MRARDAIGGERDAALPGGAWTGSPNRNTRQQPSVGRVWLITGRPGPATDQTRDRERHRHNKEKAGKALGDRHLEGKGKAEKAEGHIRSGVGKA